MELKKFTDYYSIVQFNLDKEAPDYLTEHIAKIRKAGTISLKGKSYLQVAYRVYLFRLFNPRGKVICQPVNTTEQPTPFIVEAVITDSSGTILAKSCKEIKYNATKEPGKSNPISMAETGAIGRALNLCGYGTLGGDLVEDDTNIPDGPVERW